MTTESKIPSDRDLTAAARAGDGEAWPELRRRHEPAVRRFAQGAGIGEGHVDAAFNRVGAALVADGSADVDGAGGGDVVPALRAVRLLLLSAVTGPHAGPEVSGDQTLTTIATAFGQLPEDWQAVLWHRCVDRAPAAEATVMLGRSTSGVLALEQTATRGLFDQAMVVELDADPPPPPLCGPVIAALGAYRRGSLPPAEARAIEAHLGEVDGPGSTGCDECRARLDIASRIPDLVAPAVVPWVTGRVPADYRTAAGIAAAAGVAALVDRRTAAERRRARILAVAAVLLALLAAAVLIRSPFRSFEPRLADLLERATATTVPDPSTVTSTSTIPPGPIDGDPNRVEFIFPDIPRGAVYVPGGRPLNLALSLSTPAPVFAGGTGTVDVGLTNNDSERADVTFYVRTSAGVAFDAHTEGRGTCRHEDDDGATCSVSISAGATAPMSLRFAVDRHVPDRLVVDPGVDGRALNVPVEFLADIVMGTVERGDLATVDGELVIQRDPTAPRRLIVAMAPDVDVTVASPFESSIPVAGSELPVAPRRPGRFDTTAIASGADPAATLYVAGERLGGADPFGLDAGGTSPVARSYDLDIDSSTAAVPIIASTTTSEFRLAVVALVLDIVP